MKLPLLLLALVGSIHLAGQDCLPDWDYFREIQIENSGGDLTDFQVKLTFNTGSLVSEGKLKADGSDLRFTDTDCNLLPYFMDSVATNAANVIWVKIPSIPGGTTTIRAYYGNPNAAPYANGDDTFEFFDDFESGVVDLAKWEPIGGYATLEVVDGVLNYASDGTNPGPRFKFVRTATAFTEPMIFEFAAEITNGNGFGFSSADTPISRILFRQSGFGFDTLNQVALMLDTVSNGFQVEGMYPLIRYPRFTMQDARIVAGINASNQLQLNYFGNESIGSISTAPYILDYPGEEMTGFHFIVSSFIQGPIFLDYIRVRKPALNPPVLSAGPEQENPGASASLDLAPEGTIRVFPNPSRGVVHLESDLKEALDVAVLNALGQVVWQGRFSGAIDLQSLADGPYWVVLRRSDDQAVVFSGSLLIQR